MFQTTPTMQIQKHFVYVNNKQILSIFKKFVYFKQNTLNL